MKKIRFAHVVLMSLLLLIVVACNPEAKDIKLDFKVDVPENWNETILAEEGFVYAAGRDLDDSDPNDTVAELLYVLQEPLNGFALNTYYNALVNQIKESDFYNSQIYASDTVINTINFKKLISREIMKYPMPQYQDTADINVITNRYFFFENSHGYNMVFYSVDTLYFKQNRAVFDGIMNTFEYLP